ncbi:MAG: hypothetical protein QM723_15685 [Myxococcaceae bacterium]
MNQKVRSGLEELRASFPDVGWGHAFFERSKDDRLVLKLRAESGGRWRESRRSLPSASVHSDVLSAIEAAFQELSRTLGLLPAVRLSA